MKKSMKELFLIFLLQIVLINNADNHVQPHNLSPELVNINFTDCDNGTDPVKMIDRLTEKRISGDTLFLSLCYSDNCTYGNRWKPVLQYSDDTLYIFREYQIILNPDGSVEPGTECNCCFSADIAIKGIADTSFVTNFKYGKKDNILYITDEKYETFPETFEIVNGDTINRTNKYGHMEGYWKTFDEKGLIKSRTLWKQKTIWISEPVIQEWYNAGKLYCRRYGSKDSVFYYNSFGQLVLKKYRDNPRASKTYFTNGNLKSLCLDDSCFYWDEEGNSIARPKD